MVFSITLPNDKYGSLMPQEDAFRVEDGIFCVADGITRDPISPADFGELSQKQLLENYPNPSGAKIAAELFCNKFTKLIKDGRTIRESFHHANKAINDLNNKYIKEIDYLVNDFYACVASGGVIKNKKLHWGQICDSGIIVFDRNGKVKCKTDNGILPFREYIKDKEERWGDPRRRRLIRSHFRNNPKQLNNGKVVSYGALTGEKEAEYFMNFGVQDLERDDLVVFYTDGFENILGEPSFFEALYHDNETKARQKFLENDRIWSQKSYEKFGHERTLIAVLIT